MSPRRSYLRGLFKEPLAELELMAAFEKWHRYIFASVSKHLLDSAEADSIELVVEFANKRTPPWEVAASNVEITITGPKMVQLSRGAYRAEVEIFAIVSSIFGTNGLEHIAVTGKVSDWLDQCVLVLDYGDTDSVEIGQLKPDNGDDGIELINLKPERTPDRIHSTISSAFVGRFNE